MNSFAPAHHGSLRHRIFVWMMLVVTIITLPGQAHVHAQAPNTLVLYPSTVASGAAMRVAGYGFPGLDGFEVTLESPGGAVALGQVIATMEGQILPTTMTLPDGLAPGDYEVVLRDGGGASVARAALTVRAAPTITLGATSGAPGMPVAVRVEGLVAGTLRVSFGGATVLSPLPIQGTTYEGHFVVPDGLQPGEQVVTAINAVDGVPVGRADGRFTLQTATPARYTLRDIVVPTEEVKPGRQFVVSGRMDPVPAAIDLPGYQVLALWQSDGQVFPINLAPASVNADGSFALSAQVPSLLKGDPVSPKNGDQMQVIVVAPGNMALPASKWAGALNLGAPPRLAFEAVKPDGTPIPNTPKVAGQPDPLRVVIAPLGNMFLLPRNDLTNLDKAERMLDISALWDSPSDQQIAKQGEKISNCWGRKFISKVPEREWVEFEWVGHLEQALFAANPGVDNVGLPPVARIGPIGAIGPMAQAMHAQDARAAQAQADDKVAARVFEVIVDASRVVDGAQRGYGFIENGDVAKPYVGRYMYVPELRRLFRLDDKNGYRLTEVTVPVKITLPPLPANWRTELGVRKVVARTPGDMGKEVNGNIYTFVDALDGAFPPGIRVNVVGDNTLELRAYVIPSSTGVPTSEFTIDYAGDGRGPISLGTGAAGVEPATDGNCGSGGNPPREYYSLRLPNADRVPPGEHIVGFSISDGVNSASNALVLRYAAPPAWIKDDSYLNRAADWSVFSTTLRADRFNEGNATVNLPQVKAKEISDKPDGAVDNSAGGNLSVMQVLGPTGFGSIVTSGKTRTTAVNNHRDEPFAKPNAFGNETTFGTGEKTQKIFDTGWLLIFQTVWGLPPIASATFSIKTQVEANLKYNGTITRDAQGSISKVQLDVNPSATVNVDGGLDASVLGDFVEAGVRFLPSIGVNMPVTLVNGSITALRACFNYQLRVRVYGSVGWAPFEVGFDTTKTILPYNEVCARLQAAQARAQQVGQADAAAWELPRARPAIATDGFGTILSLWRDANGDLVYRLGTAGGPQLLPGAQRGAQKPQLAFYAPNRAIAAWAESALTPAEAATLSFEDAVKQQHLVWSHWNGSGWEAPQRLTQPTTGDGSVALTGCIVERDSACPAGGAITAAWTHDAAGDLSARNFRVHIATYRGADGTWSVAQPVDDTANVTDHEPTVTYANGVAVAAWVRDEDRDLSTPDRRIALRRLTSPVANPVQLPAELQGRVNSPALSAAPNGAINLVYTVGETDASLSNQLMLHAAAQVCVLGRGCLWQVKRLADSLGRAIYAENPAPTFDSAGRLTITYRSLGFGPSQSGAAPRLPTDPAYVLIGELAKVEVNESTTSVNPSYLTAGDALYAHAAAVYDPLASRIVTLAARGSLPPGVRAQAHSASTAHTSWAAVDATVVQTSVSREPDFVIEGVRVPEGLPPAVGPFEVTARVRNDGVAWSGEGLDIVATWQSGTENGSHRVVEAGRANLSALGAGASLDVPLSLTPPPDGYGAGRRLVVSVNPSGRIAENNGQNNAHVVDIGLIAAPREVIADVRPGSPLVFLHWPIPTPADGRITGYRIYRLDSNGARMPVGSTLTHGWVDLNTTFASTTRYAITSFSVDGVESAPSEPIAVTTMAVPPAPPSQRYLPLIAR